MYLLDLTQYLRTKKYYRNDVSLKETDRTRKPVVEMEAWRIQLGMGLRLTPKSSLCGALTHFQPCPTKVGRQKRGFHVRPARKNHKSYYKLRHMGTKNERRLLVIRYLSAYNQPTMSLMFIQKNHKVGEHTEGIEN